MSDPNIDTNTRTTSLPHTNKPPPPEGQISQSTSTTSSLARTLDSSQTNQTDLTSPSKSFRNFFKSRLSTYSIDSISEEPERRKSVASSSTNQDVISPTSNKISNLLLRPKFSRSKSSSNSIQQLQQPQLQAPPSTSSFVQLNNSSNGSLQQKPVTIDDFADTESSNEDSGEHANKSYDEESVNSLLLEYQRPKTFVFKELLDEDEQDPQPQSASSPNRSKGITSGDHTILSNYDENVSIGKVERAIRVSSPPVVRQSPIPESLKDPSLRNSRGSDLISTTFSDSDHSNTNTKYPDPNLSNMATPMQTPTIKHILNNPRNSGGNDSLNSASRKLADITANGDETATNKSDVFFNDNETALKLDQHKDDSVRNSLNTNETMLKRETFRSSMSSGELLNKLQGFENTSIDKPQASSTLRYSHLDVDDDLDDLHQDRKFGNLTAGLDSNNELPFMLYKVQDKDYDEGNQRWSVYETNRASQLKQQQQQLKDDASPQVVPQPKFPPDFEPPVFPEHEDLRQGSISSSASNFDRYEEANEFFNSNQSQPSFPAPPGQSHLGIIPTQSSSSSSNQFYHTASGRDTTTSSSNLYHTVTEGTLSSGAASVSTFRQDVPDEGATTTTQPIILPPQVHQHAAEPQINVATPILSQPTEVISRSPSSSQYREITPPSPPIVQPSIPPPAPVVPIDSPRRNIEEPPVISQPPVPTSIYNQQEPEALVLSKPPPDLIIPNPSEYDGRRGISGNSPTQGQIDDDEYYIHDIEKQIMNDNNNLANRSGYLANGSNQHYSWTRFVSIMVIGLIIPPVYFLLALGVFDSSNNYQQYYSGLHYYNNRAVTASTTKGADSINKFSRTQKLISFGIGISWTLVILAMIGVGLGVGLTS